MTSSFILKSLEKTQNERGAPWMYSLPGSPLGGMEDSYIKLQGRCHPDFYTAPIGRAEGVKVCIRKPLVGDNSKSCPPTSRIGDPLHSKAKWKKEQSQGYNRGSVRLYDPQSDFPIQEWNPMYYADRRTPWEQDLLMRDYQRWPLRYSGTGIDLLRAPSQGRDEGKPYYQYGYSYTPVEDPNTGYRVASQPNQSRPEFKYDITRLHQQYPVWKNEQHWVGGNQPNGQGVDALDTIYQKRIV